MLRHILVKLIMIKKRLFSKQQRKKITSKRAIITLRADFSRKWKPENDGIFKALKEINANL